MAKQNKHGLGRGLDSLLGHKNNIPYEVVGQDSKSRVGQDNVGTIKIADIEMNPWQPRTAFEEQALKELSDSIKIHGLIQPITVRKKGDNKYQLISGERRVRASKLAGLEEIVAYVRTADDMQVIEMSLIENLQRENLNSLEIALSFERLMQECNLTQEQLSERVGKDRSTIANYLRLLKLSTPVQLLVRDNKISMAHARALVSVADEDLQEDIAKEVIEKQISVHKLEEIIKKLNNPDAETPAAKKKDNVLPKHVEEVRSDLAKHLGSKVNIKRNIKGKGLISIDFKNDAEFERIVALLKVNNQ